MFEKLRANITHAKEKVSNGWNNQVERLHDSMDKLKSRWDIFKTETKAETTLIGFGVDAIKTGVKKTVNKAKEAYSAVEGNVFNRLGNVFKEAWGGLKSRVETIKENGQKKKEEIAARYKGLGVAGTAVAVVEDAINYVSQIPTAVTMRLPAAIYEKNAMLQATKEIILIDMANKEYGKEDCDPEKLGMYVDTMDHIKARMIYMAEKADELRNKADRIRQIKKDRLVVAPAI